MSDGNGSRFVTVRWLLGILIAVLIMGAGATVKEMWAGIAEAKQVAGTAAATAGVVQAQQDADRERLGRIEDKLDRLLERVRP